VQEDYRAWDLWLDCWTQEAIAEEIGVPRVTITGWMSKIGSDPKFDIAPSSTEKNPWGNIQHFDIWQFQKAEGESSHSGFGMLILSTRKVSVCSPTISFPVVGCSVLLTGYENAGIASCQALMYAAV
jgi:hypothetical protein